jgi:hypothetical protein
MRKLLHKLEHAIEKLQEDWRHFVVLFAHVSAAHQQRMSEGDEILLN